MRGPRTRPTPRPTRRLVAALAVALAAVTHPSAGLAQDAGPVIKPGASPAPRAGRLPMPGNLQVRQGESGDIIVTWDSMPGAKLYVIGRAVGTSGFRRLDRNDVRGSTFVDGDVQPGQKYVYTVTPIDMADVSGLRATSAEFVPQPRVQQAPVVPPASVVARQLGPDVIELRWVRSGVATSFEISHRENDGRPQVIANQRETMYRMTGVRPGRHTFVVTALGPFGRTSGAHSNTIVIEAPATTGGDTSGSGGSGGGTTGGTTEGTTGGTAPRERLAAPTGLRVSQDGKGRVIFDWNAVPGAKHYRVERIIGTQPSRGGATIVTVSQYADTRPEAGKRYVYMVTAVDSADQAGARATATEFTPADPAQFIKPPTVARVEARATSDDAIALTWRAQAGERTQGQHFSFVITHVENDGTPRELGKVREPRHEVLGLRPGRHAFEITAIDGNTGLRSTPVRSNVVVLPRETNPSGAP